MARALTIALAVLLVATLGRVGDAEADDTVQRARAHYQQGLQFFEAGNYHSAITEFSAADKISPSPLLEYNMGLCYERLGDTSSALARYRSYRTRAPNAPNRAAVDAKIATLEREAGAGQPPPVGDPPVGDPPVGDPPPDGDRPPPPVNGNTTPAAPTPTGDADLDRVAAVDINAISARHPRVAGAAASQAGQPVGNSANGAGAPAPANGALPAGGNDQPKSKPLYKRWWFWVIIGVSTLILLDIALSDNSGDENFRVLDPMSGMNATPAQQQGGFTLRF